MYVAPLTCESVEHDGLWHAGVPLAAGEKGQAPSGPAVGIGITCPHPITQQNFFFRTSLHSTPKTSDLCQGSSARARVL